ncbi:unnamed protein product, partial [Polarella glacialis]
DRCFIWTPQPHAEGAPSLALQCAPAQAIRLAEYCNEAGMVSFCAVAAPLNGVEDRAVLLWLPKEADLEPLVKQLAGDANVGNCMRRAFAVEPTRHCTLSDAMGRLAALLDEKGSSCAVRVQVFPRYLEQKVISDLADAQRNLVCVSFSHIASLFYADGAYQVGVAQREQLIPEGVCGMDILDAGRPKMNSSICRAQLKLSEALARSGWAEEIAAKPPHRAVDVGAAPGGWSFCLADPSAWGCAE